MTKNNPQFEPIAKRMQDEGLPALIIDTYAYYYDLLVRGATGTIADDDIVPVVTVPDMEAFPEQLAEVGREAFTQTVIIKLNGGLGTSMGLEKAKSLLPVKEGYSFLDIIARQAIKADVPLLLMNSFSTEADSLAALQQYDELQGDLALSFLQHKVPKIVCADYSQVEWDDNVDLEWCPPGHGDIYTALITQGTLAALLEAGYKYAFVSNADNLGATLDKGLLGYLTQNDFPFIMEVADRTEMDKKGGHLARRRADGQFVLRELAQCPAEDLESFQDIGQYKYFNTNNLWINLEAFQRVMSEQDNRMRLPMIRNQKTVDPRDSESTPVFQLETAMGSAITVFKGSQAVRVPRNRFAPVKKTDDLLIVRSDVYVLSEEFEVVLNPKRTIMKAPVVELDPKYYKLASDLDARFPQGVPSMLACERLKIVGDYRFEEGVICRGSIELRNESNEQMVVPARTILED